MKIWQRWKQTAIHNKALVLTSIIVAAGTLFYAGAAAFQVWLMIKGGQHTDEQIGWVIGNVNWLARSVDLSQKMTQQAIQANEEQSRKSLQATIDNFHLDQRAWLGVEDFGLSEPIQDGKYDIYLKLFNSGKSPALNVTFGTKAGAFPTPINWKNLSRNQSFKFANNNTGSIPPQSPRTVHIYGDFSKIFPDPAYKKGIEDGSITFYVRGEINYNDTFTKIIHHTPYCMLLSTVPSTRMAECPTPNNMD
jgi:hypothetical protein